MTDKTCGTCTQKASHYCDVTTWVVDDGDECSVPSEFGGPSWEPKRKPLVTGISSSVSNYSNIVETPYIRLHGTRMPLLKNPDADHMAKHECPLCGGDLVAMGWFRRGDLHELLHKCERCGMAVFR